MIILIGLVIFLAFLIIGAPIWLSLSISGGTILFGFLGLPIETVVSQYLIATDSWILLAIPYFLLAGNLMTDLGMAKRMLKFITNLVGHLPGGMPSAAVLSCVIFGALSGSSAATVVAVGAMVVPQMLKLGYSKEQSLGIVATSGTLGQMIPPSVYMIVYASMTQQDVGMMFMAGIIPGLFIATVLIITAVILTYKVKPMSQVRPSKKEIIKSFLYGLPSLLMPIIILGGIYLGIFTPTEAAAIAVVYVLLISYIFNRKDFKKKNIIKSFIASIKTTTVIYLLLCGAVLFSTALMYIQVPAQITQFVSELSVPSWLILLAILGLYIIFGMFLDALPILYITIPIVFPTILALGYDPVHFGVITVACMMISQVTPPVGISLFVLSGHFKVKVTTVIRGSVPYLIALVLATIVLIYVPWFSTVLTK
ncbi:C4-dicarboxylate ABC transporter permease [Sporosarcina sp. P21c]|uniref:TRAP transporter large permease n=1 Tax=unclassified Sporosarcina TaxID=2647733 RepID=UPI000C16AB33|nr:MULTISPECIES: TRAP transporter large permease [unclassified Sporosarcina]PIC66184.1 C4-dicarboxylate ABC transporter permease [Sporosarcina sp. P16a]PIC88825.1 C4-dicarboxylate ABC transporter permease [Sporosarcina sp. P21c]PIC91848.1 C4-dicarboxylate ABC transporter permease [Sporosarcina sp. P25]